MSTAVAEHDQGTLFGHPTGLFTLFFAEMWERFSYYGMRALLTFYMIKGFLGYNDNKAYAVYGAYTALVYMTPYFGGMIADRLLGARRAVVLGGLLMAAGHLLMTVEQETAFFAALGLLIVGNGFFKPNISTIVGSLYTEKFKPKRDAGFTLFYMGINLGAAMSPVICGYVGETYGWHYGFGLATAGMLVGVAVFVAPVRFTQLLILGGALATSIAMPFWQDTTLQLIVRLFLSAALTTAGVVAFMALGRGGLPKWAGQPPDMTRLRKKIGGVLRADWAVYLGALLVVPIFTLIVQRNEIAGYTLSATGALALGYILYQAIFKSTKVERERLFVVVILMFFTLLFWAFFEQAGSSVNLFTDRNVDRVFEEKVVTDGDVGTALNFRVPVKGEGALAELPLLGQEQLGHQGPKAVFTIASLEALRAAPEAERHFIQHRTIEDIFVISTLSTLRTNAGKEDAPDGAKVYSWNIVPDNVGMAYGGAEIPASEFQAANPIFILIFGLLFTALWGFLGQRGIEPSTPVKFAMGIMQLGLGFGALWYGAMTADDRGMVWMGWLLLGYLLQTTGELCLSPVGLSMVTKLSPKRMVSTVMGAWFLATAFSNFLASMIATLTGVGHGEGEENIIPAPVETVNVYGDVFFKIMLVALGSAVLLFILAPLLSKWMHNDKDEDASAEAEAASEA